MTCDKIDYVLYNEVMLQTSKQYPLKHVTVLGEQNLKFFGKCNKWNVYISRN